MRTRASHGGTRVLVFTFVVWLLLPQLPAAGQTVEWIRQDGTRGIDSGWAVAADATRVYLGGIERGNCKGGVGHAHAFVRAYDVAGNETWEQDFGSPRGDGVSGVAVDSSNVVAVGFTDGTLPGQVSSGERDAFVRAFNLDGTVAWTRQFGTSSADEAAGVALDATGIYVTGTTFGTFPGAATAYNADVFVTKFDRSGNLVWTRQFGSTPSLVPPGPTAGMDWANGIAAVPAGVAVVGDVVQGTLPGQSMLGNQDGFIRLYDSGGNEIWTRQFGTSGGDGAEGVTGDSSGIYVVGGTGGSFSGYTRRGSGDAYIRCYSASGDEVWTRQFGTKEYDVARGVAADSSGIYVAGRTDGTLPAARGKGLAYVKAYGIDGSESWTRQFGTLEASRYPLINYAVTGALSVAVSPGGVFASGTLWGKARGQVSHGSGDEFVAKVG